MAESEEEHERKAQYYLIPQRKPGDPTRALIRFIDGIEVTLKWNEDADMRNLWDLLNGMPEALKKMLAELDIQKDVAGMDAELHRFFDEEEGCDE